MKDRSLYENGALSQCHVPDLSWLFPVFSESRCYIECYTNSL
jgi:hypothetical protein